MLFAIIGARAHIIDSPWIRDKSQSIGSRGDGRWKMICGLHLHATIFRVTVFGNETKSHNVIDRRRMCGAYDNKYDNTDNSTRFSKYNSNVLRYDFFDGPSFFLLFFRNVILTWRRYSYGEERSNRIHHVCSRFRQGSNLWNHYYFNYQNRSLRSVRLCRGVFLINVLPLLSGSKF